MTRRLACCLALASALAGCTSYHVTTAPSVMDFRGTKTIVRITTRDHNATMVKDAHVLADSVIGIADDNRRFAVAVDDVLEVGYTGVDIGQSIAVGAVVVVVVVATGFMLLVMALSHAG